MNHSAISMKSKTIHQILARLRSSLKSVMNRKWIKVIRTQWTQTFSSDVLRALWLFGDGWTHWLQFRARFPDVIKVNQFSYIWGPILLQAIHIQAVNSSYAFQTRYLSVRDLVWVCPAADTLQGYLHAIIYLLLAPSSRFPLWACFCLCFLSWWNSFSSQVRPSMGMESVLDLNWGKAQKSRGNHECCFVCPLASQYDYGSLSHISQRNTRFTVGVTLCFVD